ncbi:unnamed protein product [Polarella glacialis]|uniref:Methylenetetrahydrofolate reductase (NAD(P)H) n=1 Tax=Polarella glacialis TaxID=89957 RepID=A0A813D5Q8_POLGL|nr:unnamed protein product [Polarella glacialis]
MSPGCFGGHLRVGRRFSALSGLGLIAMLGLSLRDAVTAVTGVTRCRLSAACPAKRVASKRSVCPFPVGRVSDRCFATSLQASGVRSGLEGREVQSRTPLGRRLRELGETLAVEITPDPTQSTGSTSSSSSGSALQRAHSQLAASCRLQPGSPVFVNMVQTSHGHFQDVVATSSALHAEGFAPVPHVPVSRFSSAAEFEGVLAQLREAGARELLLIGGNDLAARGQAGALWYQGGAAGLLEAEAPAMRQIGFERVAIAGHPDGLAGLNWDEEASAKTLLRKARLVLAAGLDVVVATQFCFDPRRLLLWLRKTRAAMKELQEDFPDGPSKRSRVIFRIGMPGPTPLKKLLRIAKLCEVPSRCLQPSAFDLVVGSAGRATLADLERAAGHLGLATSPDCHPDLRLRELFARHASPADEHLGRHELALLLAEYAEAESKLADVRASSTSDPSRASSLGPSVSGPSAFVTSATSDGEAVDRLVSPEDILLSLAAHCEQEGIPSGEITALIFPFGGLPHSLEMAGGLRNGSWPPQRSKL